MIFALIRLTKIDRIILLSNTILSVIINNLIKIIIERPRPSHLRLIEQGGYSFPSGHSMIAVLLYGTLIYFVNKNIKTRKLKIFFNIFFIQLILLIGISRIYLGVHYPSDVLGGYFLSLTIIIINISFCNNKFRGD